MFRDFNISGAYIYYPCFFSLDLCKCFLYYGEMGREVGFGAREGADLQPIVVATQNTSDSGLLV